LLEALERTNGTLLVAGEALSHCVAASVQDLIGQWDAERLQRTVLLTDCMSPVPGFEAMGVQFLEAARACGVRTQAIAALQGA
jgi:nicotinamidase-related amidase